VDARTCNIHNSLENVYWIVYESDDCGCILSADAHRALELLEDYHSQLTNATERPLRSAIERVIRIFKSRLFQALLGIQLYHLSLCIHL